MVTRVQGQRLLRRENPAARTQPGESSFQGRVDEEGRACCNNPDLTTLDDGSLKPEFEGHARAGCLTTGNQFDAIRTITAMAACACDQQQQDRGEALGYMAASPSAVRRLKFGVSLEFECWNLEALSS